MTKSPTVIAVVVTYNRAALLTTTLAALEAQVPPPSQVVVVNNASTDDTEMVLAGFQVRNPDLVVKNLTSNTGGAGGFNVGMSQALSLGADWVWVMDDDVAPEPDCLQKLFAYTGISECVHPRRLTVDGTDYGWEQYLDVATGSRTQLGTRSFDHGKDVLFTNVACFEGMLVSRRIVETIGLPDPVYFIGEDDTLFGLKASVHTNVALARDAIMRRLLPLSEPAPWRAYYSVRNQYLLWHDSNYYLKLEPGLSQKIAFAVARITEAGAFSKQGAAYRRSVSRGTRDGLRYIRSARKQGR